VALPCVNKYDYSRGWQTLWPTDLTLIGVEHDMEVDDGLIDELLACPEPFCTWAYLLHQPSTGGVSHYAQRLGAKPPAGGDWIREGVEWCSFTGIGFCKITAVARVRPLKEGTWQFVDCQVSKATDVRVHVHWPPVAHHHLE